MVLSDPELRRFYDDELHGAKRGKVAQTQAGRVAEEQRRQTCREKIEAMVAALSRARPQSAELEREAQKRASRDALQRDVIEAREAARQVATAARQNALDEERRRLSKLHSRQLHLPASQALSGKRTKPVAPSERGRRREAAFTLLGAGFAAQSGPATEPRRSRSASDANGRSSGAARSDRGAGKGVGRAKAAGGAQSPSRMGCMAALPRAGASGAGASRMREGSWCRGENGSAAARAGGRRESR